MKLDKLQDLVTNNITIDVTIDTEARSWDTSIDCEYGEEKCCEAADSTIDTRDLINGLYSMVNMLIGSLEEERQARRASEEQLNRIEHKLAMMEAHVLAADRQAESAKSRLAMLEYYQSIQKAPEVKQEPWYRPVGITQHIQYGQITQQSGTTSVRSLPAGTTDWSALATLTGTAPTQSLTYRPAIGISNTSVDVTDCRAITGILSQYHAQVANGYCSGIGELAKCAS